MLKLEQESSHYLRMRNGMEGRGKGCDVVKVGTVMMMVIRRSAHGLIIIS